MIMELGAFFLKKDFSKWSHAQKTQEASVHTVVSRFVQLCICVHCNTLHLKVVTLFVN